MIFIKIKIYITKILLSAILLIVLNSFLESNNKLHKIIFESKYNYIKINNITKILLNKKDSYVSNNSLNYNKIIQKENYEILILDNKTSISNIKEGNVIFIGNIKDKGKTITINTNKNENISYSNLENISVNLYDYVNKDEIIGNTVDNRLILSIKKDDKYIKYEDYI